MHGALARSGVRLRSAGLLGVATPAGYLLANLRNPLLNDDGVLYLLLAGRIAEQGLDAAFALFDRPFYAWLIALLHGATGLSLRASALALDGALAVLLVLAFADFCRVLYRDERIVPWAALLLLLHPKFNNYLAFVFRDTGYWAALLASFGLLLRYLDAPRPRLFAGWAACTLVAAAFRPEALLFGVLAPLALLSAPAQPRGRRMLHTALAGAALLLVLLVLAWLVPASQPELRAHSLDVLDVLPSLFRDEIPSAFAAASARFAEHVLDPQSRSLAPLGLAGALLTILAFKLLNTLGPAQLLVLLCGLVARKAPAPMPLQHTPAWLAKAALLVVASAVASWASGDARILTLAVLVSIGAATRGLIDAHGLALPPGRTRVLMLLLGVALLISAVFLGYRLFLDSRYVMLAVLLLLAPAARVLQMLIAGAAGCGRRTLIACLAGVLMLLGGDLVHRLDRTRPYLRDCAARLPALVAPGSRVFSNDRRLAWHSGGSFEWQHTQEAGTLIASGSAPLADVGFWILHRRADRPPHDRELAPYAPRLRELHRCEDPRRGDAVVVYAVHS